MPPNTTGIVFPSSAALHASALEKPTPIIMEEASAIGVENLQRKKKERRGIGGVQWFDCTELIRYSCCCCWSLSPTSAFNKSRETVRQQQR